MASSEAPTKARVPRALGQLPTSASTMWICSGTSFSRRLLAHPAGTGGTSGRAALQDAQLGAGGRFLGMGRREI